MSVINAVPVVEAQTSLRRQPEPSEHTREIRERKEDLARIRAIVESGQAAEIDLSDHPNPQDYVTKMQAAIRMAGLSNVIHFRKRRSQPIAFAYPASDTPPVGVGSNGRSPTAV